MFPRFLALFLLLAPLLRAEAPPVHKFEKEILAYEAAAKTNPPPSGAIVFTGASGIRRWSTLAQDFPGLPVVNRGFGGSEISDSIHYAGRIVIPYRPRTIVLQAGGNDLKNGKTPEQVFADFQTWVKQVRAALPEVKIVFLNIGPSPARWEQREQQQQANHLILAFSATEKNLAYVDLWPSSIGADGLPRPELYVEDRLHPSAEAYQIRARLLRPLLE